MTTASIVLRPPLGFGRFERSLRVPGGLDPDAVEAALTDGVLRIRILLPETKRARRIEIKAGENGGRREESGESGNAKIPARAAASRRE